MAETVLHPKFGLVLLKLAEQFHINVKKVGRICLPEASESDPQPGSQGRYNSHRYMHKASRGLSVHIRSSYACGGARTHYPGTQSIYLSIYPCIYLYCLRLPTFRLERHEHRPIESPEETHHANFARQRLHELRRALSRVPLCWVYVREGWRRLLGWYITFSFSYTSNWALSFSVGRRTDRYAKGN